MYVHGSSWMRAERVPKNKVKKENTKGRLKRATCHVFTQTTNFVAAAHEFAFVITSAW